MAGTILGIVAIRALSSEKQARQKSEDQQLSRDAMLGVLSALGGSGRGASGKTLLIAALVGLLAGSFLFEEKPSGDEG